MTDIITITESAFKRIAELVKADKRYLRIAVDGGGCSGFSYKYEMVSEKESDDLVFEGKDSGLLVDPISIEYMKGSVVDFIEDLGSSGFSVTNPQAASKCGCGNSFSI